MPVLKRWLFLLLAGIGIGYFIVGGPVLVLAFPVKAVKIIQLALIYIPVQRCDLFG